MSYRIGLGYDVHAFEADRPLFLGGVKIPYSYGLAGHSDADVLIHAICDALLGALALGDIGYHFPDKDPEFKNIDSKILLQRTYDIIHKKGYSIQNLDTVLILEKPKISGYIDQMRMALGDILRCDIQKVSIKATTTEKLGFTGREEGVAAQAIVLLKNDMV